MAPSGGTFIWDVIGGKSTPLTLYLAIGALLAKFDNGLVEVSVHNNWVVYPFEMNEVWEYALEGYTGGMIG